MFLSSEGKVEKYKVKMLKEKNAFVWKCDKEIAQVGKV